MSENNNMTEKKNIGAFVWVALAVIVLIIGAVVLYNMLPDVDEPSDNDTILVTDGDNNEELTTPKVTVPPIVTTTTSPTVITEPTTTSISIDDNGEEIQIQTNTPSTFVTTTPPETTPFDEESYLIEQGYITTPPVDDTVTTIPTTVVTTTTTQAIGADGFPLNPYSNQEVVVDGQKYIYDDLFGWLEMGGMHELTNSPEDQAWIDAGDHNIKYGE